MTPCTAIGWLCLIWLPNQECDSCLRGVWGAPVDLLRVETQGRPARLGDAAATGAAIAADAQPALSDARAADHRLQLGASGAWSRSDLGRASPSQVGWDHRLAKRRVAGAQASRPQSSRQALGLDRRLRRALPAAP